ncbi:hypothetical protein LCGC14_2134780, partial [marine sediment metagenome]
SKNLTGLGTLSAFTLGGTMDANSQALINVLNLDLGTESATGTFDATLTAANAGTAWLIRSRSVNDIQRPRLGLSGGVDTAVWAWVSSTHTGIVLSGALDADGQAITNHPQAITDNVLVTVDGPAAGAPASGEYAKWTASGIEGRSKAEQLSDLNVADGADVTGSNAPQAHKASHQDTGGDEISVTALSGLLADDQHVLDAEVTAVATAHSLATAVSDFLVASGAGVFVKQTLAQVKTLLAIASDIATHAALSVAGTHGSTTAATADKLVHRDAAGRGKVVAPSVAGDIALKSTVTADITTHNNVTNAHGAVSTATASKIVVRDAEGQAAFAAPAGAGDALIKGTRHLIAEMPTLTTDKIWKGVAGVPAEVDAPAAGAVITTGSYVGNSSVNRAIPHGLGVTPKFVFINEGTSSWRVQLQGQVASLFFIRHDASGIHTVTIPNSTNFYVGNAISYNQSVNVTGTTYYWVAFA